MRSSRRFSSVLFWYGERQVQWIVADPNIAGLSGGGVIASKEVALCLCCDFAGLAMRCVCVASYLYLYILIVQGGSL
jgi:hypothetical protein